MSARPITIGVGGFYEEHLRDNYLFTHPSAGIGDDLLKPMNQLYETGRQQGVVFSTLDRLGDVSGADAFLFLDFPRVGNPLTAKALASERPKLLATLESPIVLPENWAEEHHRIFTRIFTYLDPLVDGSKYVKLNYARELPLHTRPTAAGRSRLCTMIAGAKGSKATHNLYAERLAAIRWFERNRPGDFDLYGLGWDPTAFPSYRGPVASKRAVLQRYRFSLCYENVRDVPGYITEKIFDCLAAGCVPVYRGADNVQDHIPAACFVDLREFPSYEALHAHLAGMSDADYARHQEAIRRFLGGPACEPFSTRRFCETILREATACVEESRRKTRVPRAQAAALARERPVATGARRASYPRVSVCIPTHDRTGFLFQAVESALAQDHPNLEIVIGDNASTDETEAMCRRYARDPRVRYYRSAVNQGGLANMRNLVHHYATGDFALVLCDDDRLYDTSYLSKAAELIRRHQDVKLVFANCVVWHEGQQAVVGASDFKAPEFMRGPELFDRWWQSVGGDAVHVPFLTGLFHRETAVGFSAFDTEDVMAGDTVLWWKLLLSGNAGFVDTRAAIYRVHGGNDCTTASLRKHLPNLKMFINPARLAVEAGHDLAWIRAWKHRMAGVFLSTIAVPEVHEAFVGSGVAKELQALYERAASEGLSAEAEHRAEDEIIARASARLLAVADGASAPVRSS